uniref:Uncharacterized protein n=1 Tax=Oryza punctata TaxID=4537 RepID=A0A0E0JKK9_ORYPU
MLLAVEGGGFFSSSASGYSHGLALLLLGRKDEEKPVKVSPWNQYRLVDREAEQVYHLASRKDQAPGKCAPFICFGRAAAGLEGASPPKLSSGNTSGSSSEESSASANEGANGSLTGNEKKGCLKSNSRRDSLEHCIVVSEGEEPRESLEEVQTLKSGMERRKVQWTDTCGKELFEIREFEASDEGLSDDDMENEGFRKSEVLLAGYACAGDFSSIRMASAHGLTGTVGWSRMSERAVPMSSPCKPHKQTRHHTQTQPKLAAQLRRWHSLFGEECVSDSLGSLAPPHTLIHSGLGACVQTFSTRFLPSISFLPRTKQGKPPPLAEKKKKKKKKKLAMSLAPSIPSIKVKVGGVAVAVSPPHHRACRSSFAVIRSSKAEGAPRRPAAPPLSPPPKTPTLSTPPTLSQPPTPVKPAAPSSSSPPPSQDSEPKPVVAPVAVAAPAAAGSVTLEYQRKVAKDLQDYFKQKKLDEADQGPFFGFLGKNEIANGRWAMFGFAVGMLTEYATGSDFVQQVKILLSNFGIVDLD